jgi:hypothetical protein
MVEQRLNRLSSIARVGTGAPACPAAAFFAAAAFTGNNAA